MKTFLVLALCTIFLASCSDDTVLVQDGSSADFEAQVALDSRKDPNHKADICHWANSNKVFKINIDSSAVAMHFANHGNGVHTDGFPGQPPYDEECNLLTEVRCPCFTAADLDLVDWNVCGDSSPDTTFVLALGGEGVPFAYAGCDIYDGVDEPNDCPNVCEFDPDGDTDVGDNVVGPLTPEQTALCKQLIADRVADLGIACTLEAAPTQTYLK